MDSQRLDTEARKLDEGILAFVRQSFRFSPSEQAFQPLALRIFEYQFRRNKNYRKFCLVEGKGPDGVKSWKEIPAMPSVGFKELVLAAFPLGRTVKVFETSGTTRGEKRGKHFFDTLRLYEASLFPAFKRYLMPDGGRFQLFFLTAPPHEAPFSSLSYMMEVLCRKLGKERKGRFYVRDGQLEYERLLKDLKTLGKSQMAMILATAFSLKGFLDFLRDKKISLSLKEGSRLMETGGFKGKTKEISKEELYAACEERLGIPEGFCVSEYGMTELSSQCYDTRLYDKMRGVKRKPLMEGPPWMRTLVIDPATGQEAKKGQVGFLRHFDLANRGSVMAVQTEDAGRAVEGGFVLLGRAPEAPLRGCSLSYEEGMGRS